MITEGIHNSSIKNAYIYFLLHAFRTFLHCILELLMEFGFKNLNFFYYVVPKVLTYFSIEALGDILLWWCVDVKMFAIRPKTLFPYKSYLLTIGPPHFKLYRLLLQIV